MKNNEHKHIYIKDDLEKELGINLKKFFEMYNLDLNRYSDKQYNVFERYGLDEDLIKSSSGGSKKVVPYLVQDTLAIMVDCYTNDPLYNKQNITIDDIFEHNRRIFKKAEELNHSIKNNSAFTFNENLEESLRKLRERLILIFELLLSKSSLIQYNKINYLIRILDNLLLDISKFECINEVKDSPGYLLDLVLKEEIYENFKKNKKLLERLNNEEDKEIIDEFINLDKNNKTVDKWIVELKRKEFTKIMLDYNKNKKVDLLNENEDNIFLKDLYEEKSFFSCIEGYKESYNAFCRKYPDTAEKYLIYKPDIKEIIFSFFYKNINDMVIKLVEIYVLSLKQYKTELFTNIDKYEQIEDFLFYHKYRLKQLFGYIYKLDFYTDYYCKAYSYFYDFGSIVINERKNFFEYKVRYIIEVLIRDNIFDMFSEIFKVKCTKHIIYMPDEEILNKIILGKNQENDLRKIQDIILRKIEFYLTNDKDLTEENETLKKCYSFLEDSYESIKKKHEEKVSYLEGREKKAKNEIEKLKEEKNILKQKSMSSKQLEEEEKELKDKIKKERENQRNARKELDNLSDLHTYISKALGITVYNTLKSDMDYMSDKKNKICKRNL